MRQARDAMRTITGPDRGSRASQKSKDPNKVASKLSGYLDTSLIDLNMLCSGHAVVQLALEHRSCAPVNPQTFAGGNGTYLSYVVAARSLNARPKMLRSSNPLRPRKSRTNRATTERSCEISSEITLNCGRIIRGSGRTGAAPVNGIVPRPYIILALPAVLMILRHERPRTMPTAMGFPDTNKNNYE